MGGITQDKIHWQNRPTYQQVVQFPSRRGQNVTNLAAKGDRHRACPTKRDWNNLPPSNALDGNPIVTLGQRLDRRPVDPGRPWLCATGWSRCVAVGIVLRQGLPHRGIQ